MNNKELKNNLELTKDNIQYFTNQIHNSRQHLQRNWDLLKDKSKNWTRPEICEIAYNIQKEAEYLGECRVKLAKVKN